tara:strand:- start:15197 stop:16342 length:1146 start_codon:yes stop_codon:yes gene_type:complete
VGASYEVAVIGRGLIGSAAARHLAEAGCNVIVIGPDEPLDRRVSQGPFCSHPDEGRITRIAGRTPIWSQLAARSIARYADIADRSGIEFHSPCGLVSSSPKISEWLENSELAGGDAHSVDSEWVSAETGISLTNGHPVLYEGAPAGYINPRSLVKAQTELVGQAKGVVVTESASTITALDGGYQINGNCGSLSADRVLVTTGAFGSELLQRPLDLRRMPRTTVTAEISIDSDLPSLICVDPPDERLQEIYWVPPVRYSDGRVALKIGGDLRDAKPVAQDALTPWFQGDGDSLEVEALKNSLLGLLPGVEVASWAQKPCVVTNTASGHPYIGWVEDGVAVALGGCGSAAKSSDELGRLAAELFKSERWIDSLPSSAFDPVFA